MGKSPGKWIKTLLFGKKTTRSNSSKGLAAGKASAASDVVSSVNSGPLIICTSSNVINTELENTTPKGLKVDVVLTSEIELDLDTESKSIPVGIIGVPCDDPCVDEVQPLQSISGDDNIPMMNGGFSIKKDQTYNENPKSGKRRASIAAKSEYEENGVQTNTLPSYMAATESAKAKLRAQNSPRVCSKKIQLREMA